MFKPWQLALIDEAGYNGIREEHIQRVAESLLSTELSEIDQDTLPYVRNRSEQLHSRGFGLPAGSFEPMIA